MTRADRPVRVVVHAGFHKTGTTTVQRFLHANRQVLWKKAILAHPWRIRPLLSACRGYSTWRDPVSLSKAAHRLHRFLDELPARPGRALCFCSEELSGHLPGRGDQADYGAAPPLMAEIAAVLADRYGPALDLRFLFTTRAPAAWLRSAWAEHVKSSTMTLDAEAFATRFAAAADLPGMVARIRAAVAPWPVTDAALEDASATALGPATPLVDLLDLPPHLRRRLVPAAPANPAPTPAALADCLAINRAAPDADTARARKDAVLGRTPRQA